MGKRKRRQRAELPLFDLPLNPGRSESGSAADLELSKGSDLSSESELSPGSPPSLPAGETPRSLEDSELPGASEDRPAPDLSSLFARRDASAGTQRELLEPMAEDGVLSKPGQADQQGDSQVDHVSSDDRDLDGADSLASLGDRVLGGLADLAAQVLVLGMAIAATHSMGVTVTLVDWQPFAMLMLAFSFLYWTVPLAFWGQTPGMAWVGHIARTGRGQPLTFGQTFLRWLGAILTLAFVGLPILTAWTGRSLSDIISKSRTLSSNATRPSE